MFEHESKPSRIYAYKVKAFVGGYDVVEDQLHRAHRYGNLLIELERGRRGASAAVVERLRPLVAETRLALEAASGAVEAALGAASGRNRDARSRTASPPAERAALAALKRARTGASAAYKAAKADAYADPEVRAELAAVEAADNAARKAARAGCGLYWGTYLMVETARRGDRKGAPPEFRRWDGDGAVAVQAQGGLDWYDATLDDDTRVRVRPEPVRAAPMVSKAGAVLPAPDPNSARSRAKGTAVVWLRVGTAPGGRAPVWCKVRIHLHRRPPPGSRIKWVYLHRSVVGQTAHWQVQFVLSRDEWPREGQAANGATGVDVNWRLTPDGLRVAYALGDDGAVTTCVLPREWLGAWERVETLRSIRDGNFNLARDAVAAFLASHEAPEPVRGRSATISQWRSPGRLAALVRLWRAHRFDGDAAAFDAAEAWRKQDRHLHDWEGHQHTRIVRRRDDLYRKFAARLARSYRTAFIEATDWKALRAAPQPGEPDRAAAARVYARVASPGRLSELIREAAAECVRVDPADTTRRCHACSRVDDFDAGRDLFHTCSGCGATWDQDHNAAVWLLRGGCRPAPAEA